MRNVVVTDPPRADAGDAEQLGGFGVATVHEALGRVGYLGPEFRPAWPGARIGGTAVTVLCWPGDNLMIHACLNLAQAGQVLVFTNGGSSQGALWGDVACGFAKKKGVAGAVVDGAVRDSLEIDEMDYPVFSVGTNPNGPTKNIGGRIGHPVTVGGVTVRAGDFVIGDGDGVMVVEREKIASLIGAARKKVQDETKRIAAIKDGNTAAAWLDGALRAAGVLKEGETL